MIQIKKRDVANWLLLDYQAKLHAANEKLRFFENKYDQSWETFEQNIKTANKENFSQWDDYIEWKSYIKTAEEISLNIQEVKNGHFAVT